MLYTGAMRGGVYRDRLTRPMFTTTKHKVYQYETLPHV